VKFRCEQSRLAEGLAQVSRAVSSRPANAVHQGIFLEAGVDGTEALRLVGTDGELTIEATIPVAVDRGGIALLPARLTTDVVRALPAGRVDVEVRDDEARLSGERVRSQSTVRTLPPEHFTRQPAIAVEPVTLPAATFAEALRQVGRAASTDDARPILTGVLFTAEDGGLRLVATDSYRLALRDLPDAKVLGADQRVLVPVRALNEVARILGSAPEGDVSLRLGEQVASFEHGGVTVTTSLIGGDFPNYRQLLPSAYPNRVVVARTALLDALKRMKVISSQHTNAPVRLTLTADGIGLSVQAKDVGEATEQVDADYHGSELTIAFNPDYLSSGAEAVGGEQLLLECVDPMRPAIVRPVDDDTYLYLLMPVRV
jgi:DNA polymerase-3 subunit beta